ncbi:RNA polymerase sigma factor [Streptomyces sp. NPDC088337]|uniref:RNA polymerase sigma factor n=1 Tax=unclassified Streptomyces TaxID=2593676 RepID=UPI003804827E
MPKLRRRAGRSASAWLADDAVQEACEKLLMNADRLISHPNPQAYAFRTVTTVLIDQHRQTGREVPFPDLPDFAGKSEASDVESAWEAGRLLNLLSPGQSAAVRLVDVEGYTIDQAAEVLGVHRGTVSRARARGLSALRRKFLPTCHTEGQVEPLPE